ncbi:MAG: HipA N-terminal domain-containing protein [Thermoguttaceae bacterium]|jgi:HipA-like protein
MSNRESLWSRMRRYWAAGGAYGTPNVEPSRKAVFHVLYGNIEVGTLESVDGVWKFRYSDEFRKDGNRLRAITEFPDSGREYVSPELWPFFAMRIPSLKQAEIKAIVEREHIDEKDEATLLRRFGRRTVANPFELVESAS